MHLNIALFSLHVARSNAFETATQFTDQYSSAFYPTAAQVRGEAMSIILQKMDDL